MADRRVLIQMHVTAQRDVCGRTCAGEDHDAVVKRHKPSDGRIRVDEHGRLESVLVNGRRNQSPHAWTPDADNVKGPASVPRKIRNASEIWHVQSRQSAEIELTRAVIDESQQLPSVAVHVVDSSDDVMDFASMTATSNDDKRVRHFRLAPMRRSCTVARFSCQRTPVLWLPLQRRCLRVGAL